MQTGTARKWERDVQGRVTREVRADNTTDTLYTYDLAGRLKTVTDPKDQVTTHSYNLDDSLSGTAYTNEDIETPNVSYTYDTYYARVATMVDGIGTTTYTYKAPARTARARSPSVDGPLSNDTIAYTYDELGRVTERAINGSANTVTWAFDALGRVTSEVNLLGDIYLHLRRRDEPTRDRRPTRTSQTSTYSYLDDAGRSSAADDSPQISEREHVIKVRLHLRRGREHPDVAAAGRHDSRDLGVWL